MASVKSEARLTLNALSDLAIEGGTPLLDTMAGLFKLIRVLTGGLVKLAQEFPRLTSALVHLTAVLVSVRVATIALGFAFTFLRAGLLTTVLQVGRVAGALRMVTAAVSGGAAMRFLMRLAALRPGRLFTAALGFTRIGRALALLGTLAMAHPILALVGVLAVGAIAIVRNWDRVKSWFSGFFAFMENQFTRLADAMPEWLRDSLGLAGRLLTPPSLRPVFGAIGGSEGRSEVRGGVRVRIDGPPGTTVDEVRSDTPGFEVEAYRGLLLGFG